eukprot:gene9486-1727_t
MAESYNQGERTQLLRGFLFGQPEYGVRRHDNKTLKGNHTFYEIPYIVFEKDVPGSAWSKRYDRLHLHTVRDISQLPFWGFPENAPTFVSRTYLAKYYQAYALFHNVRSNTLVVSTKYDESGQLWSVVTRSPDGAEQIYTSKVLTICTGQEAIPKIPHFDGESSFPGRILHSQDYMNGKEFEGKRVLVIGFGNSGSEIALDLWEWNAVPTALTFLFRHIHSLVQILARSAVHMVPRYVTRILGHLFPIVRSIPPTILDGSQSLMYSLIWGDLSPYNITLKKSGIFHDIVEHHKSPIQDIGTMNLIKNGEISVINQEITRIDGSKVYFKDGSSGEFDHIVLATGFEYSFGPYTSFLDTNIVSRLPNKNKVVPSGEEVDHQPRLYLLGFDDYLGRLGCASTSLNTELKVDLTYAT